ncbi:hypothetical protein HPP92_012473 [Vanilla planifolia]|uniref:Uncharacterized protein n=1 Tax=Vanilla planifolia TaxID=51239 RepID=A0A835V2S2_VANPL|nr:hypothetical protein HPP92_012473 [Vanilla planifolia]
MAHPLFLSSIAAAMLLSLDSWQGKPYDLLKEEKLRVALYVQKAALTFIGAANNFEYELPEEAREAGFYISPDELATIAREHDSKD